MVLLSCFSLLLFVGFLDTAHQVDWRKHKGQGKAAFYNNRIDVFTRHMETRLAGQKAPRRGVIALIKTRNKQKTALLNLY